MEMPRPSADHEKLHRLAGTWKGTENMHPSQWCPQGSTAEGTTRSRVAMDGFCIVADYEQTSGGKKVFEGHGVYTWNSERNQVVLYWFDSMGGSCEEFCGDWDGDTLTLESENPIMGRMRMTYDFSGERRLGSRMECSRDGGESWSTMFDGEYMLTD